MARPIRKKAFFRAWKRRELWAIVPYKSFYLFNGEEFLKCIPDKNCPEDRMYVMWTWGDL